MQLQNGLINIFLQLRVIFKQIHLFLAVDTYERDGADNHCTAIPYGP